MSINNNIDNLAEAVRHLVAAVDMLSAPGHDETAVRVHATRANDLALEVLDPPKPRLKTLEQSNAEAQSASSTWHHDRPNGIACPKCGKEMTDPFPFVGTQRGWGPSEVNTHCPACGFKTTRLA